MTIKKDGPEQGRAGEGQNQNQGAGAQGAANAAKKPTATIELKATEIKTEVKAEAARMAEAVKSGATSAADAAKAEAGKVADAAKSAASAAAGKVEAAKDAAKDVAKDIGKDLGRDGGKPSAAPVAPAARGSGIGGFFSHLAAGVVGGFLALLGADTVGQKILPELGLPAPNAAASEANAALQKRIAALEAAPKAAAGAVDSALSAKLAALEQRLAGLDGVKDMQAKLAADTNALADKVGRAVSGDETAARVGKLEDKLASLVAAAGSEPGKSVPQLAALTGKFADLEQTVGNQLAAVRKGIGEQIEARVNQVAEAAELAKSGTARLDKDVAQLKSEAVRLKADDERMTQGLRGLQEETASIKSAVDGLRGDLDARLKSTAKPADVSAAVGPVASKLQALESSVASVVKSEDTRKANAERILLSLELGNLKRTIERGSGFAKELAEVNKAAGGRVDLSALDRFKDQGVTPLPELVNQFRAVATAVLDADAEPAGGGVVDRLLAGAKSVVRVRKTTAGADEQGTEAVLARMDAALKEARLGDVLAEAAKLPAKAAAPARDWLTKVEAKNTVDRAIGAVETSLKASLAAAPEAAADGTAKPAAATEKK